MVVLLALAAYTLHLVALPQGWLPTDLNAGFSLARPTNAVIGRDGSIAVLLSRPSNTFGEGSVRLVVVHPNDAP